MARNYTTLTIKTLFALAKECAYPSCSAPLVLTDRGAATVVAQIAHIRSEAPNGPRHDPAYVLDINGPQNLLLLCGLHHPPVDRHESLYPVAELEAWKAAQVAAAGAGTQLTDQQVRAFVRLTDEERQAITQIARIAERVMVACEQAQGAAQLVLQEREDSIQRMRRSVGPIIAVPDDGSPERDITHELQLSPLEEKSWQAKLLAVLNQWRPTIDEAVTQLREEVAVLRMMSADLRLPAEEVRLAAVAAVQQIGDGEAFHRSAAAMEAAVSSLWSAANGHS